MASFAKYTSQELHTGIICFKNALFIGVQKDSDAVWQEFLRNKDGVGKDWYKATIQINAYPDKPWTAQAVKSDGTFGQAYTFN